MVSRTETKEIVLSTPAGKKNFEGLPRAPECTDRARPSTIVSGRASLVDYLAFRQKVLLRRDTFEKVREFHKHNFVPGIDIRKPLNDKLELVSCSAWKFFTPLFDSSSIPT